MKRSMFLSKTQNIMIITACEIHKATKKQIMIL